MTSLRRSVWGPACWTMLHTCATACDNPRAFVTLLRMLPHTLPCPECRLHLAEHLSASPPETSIVDAQSAARYVFDLHNRVNAQCNKTPFASREAALRFMEETYGDKISDPPPRAAPPAMRRLPTLPSLRDHTVRSWYQRY